MSNGDTLRDIARANAFRLHERIKHGRRLSVASAKTTAEVLAAALFRMVRRAFLEAKRKDPDGNVAVMWLDR